MGMADLNIANIIPIDIILQRVKLGYRQNYLAPILLFQSLIS